MAGHSKWSNIKHRKAAQDARRARVFTRIIRELTVAARDGGGDINDNATLRTVVEKAKAAQMPRETIDRAIARGTGGQEGADLRELTYEGYAPGGVAVLVEVLTDNRNRTVAEVRHAFSRAEGSLGTDGSVAYLFDKRGVIAFAPGVDEDQLIELALEAGVEDVEPQEDGSVEVVTRPERLPQIRETLEASGLSPVSAEVTRVPLTSAQLDIATGEKVLHLLERLEQLEDVQQVYINAELPAELICQDE